MSDKKEMETDVLKDEDVTEEEEKTGKAAEKEDTAAAGEEEVSDDEEDEEDDEKEHEPFNLTAFIFDWANAGVVAIAIVVVLLTFVIRQVTVSGNSMNDTLTDKDRLIISSVMYTPKDGDIVVISHGSSYDEPIIKRVIAVGGQSLSIDYDTGEVAVDGVILDEPYIKGVTRRTRHPLEVPSVIPEGYVFVMGDNRENSLDSRCTDIGLIPVDNIIGKAEYRVYPFSEFGTI